MHGGDALHVAGDGAGILQRRAHRTLAQAWVRVVVMLVVAVVGLRMETNK